MNLTDRFRKALEDVRDKTLAKAASEAAVEVRAAEERGRREVLSYIGEAFVKSVVGGTVPAFSRHSDALPALDPVSALIAQPALATPADRLTREAKSLGLSLQLADLIEGVRRGVPADVWAYDDLLAACEDEWGTERFTKADRSHLVRKVIQNKLGRRQVVWVRPQDADKADRGVPVGEDGKPTKPQPVAKTREQLVESRTVLANAVSNPNRLNPEQVRALADHIDSITKDEAKGLLRVLGQKVSGQQMEVADRLLRAIRAGREQGKGVGDALQRAGNKTTGQYGAWGAAAGGGEKPVSRDEFPKRGVGPGEKRAAEEAEQKAAAGEPESPVDAVPVKSVDDATLPQDKKKARQQRVTDAVKVATDAGVEVEPNGRAMIRKFMGAKSADKTPAMQLDGKVYINEKSDYWSDPEVAKREHARGWWSTDDPNGIIHHEVAHALQEQAGHTADSMKNESFTPGQKQILDGKVSRYAMTHPREFVAEVYAGLKTGKTYDADVMRFYGAFKGPEVAAGQSEPAPTITPAEFDRRMSALDPRDSGNVKVPAKPRPLSADDRDSERYDAAKDKLRRMEGWQADRPSVAADNAVAGARERVRGVVGEEGQGEVARSPGKAAAQDEKATSSKITAPQSKIKDAFEQAKQELKDVSNGKVKFASPKEKVDRIDHLRDVMGVYDTLSRHTRDKSELGDLGHSGEAIADALSRIGEGGDPAKESDSGGEKKPVTPTPAKPTDGMDTNQPTADVQKRIAQIRSRLADADNPDVGMPYGEQMKLMDELDRLTTPPEELRRREVATSAGSRIRSAMIEAARKAEEQTKSRQTNVEGKNKDEIAAGHTARGLQATEAKRLASDLEGMKQYRAMSDDERDALGTVSRQFFYQMYRKYGNKYGNAADLHPEDVAKMVDNHKKAGMQVPKEIAEQHAKHTAQAPTTTAHPDDAELAALNRKPFKQLTPAEKKRRAELSAAWDKRRNPNSTPVMMGGGPGPGRSGDGDREMAEQPTGGHSAKPVTRTLATDDGERLTFKRPASHALIGEIERLKAAGRDTAAAEIALANAHTSDQGDSDDKGHRRALARALHATHRDANRLGRTDAAGAVDDLLTGEHVGAQRIGKVGETVPFDPVRHESDGSVSTGTPEPAKPTEGMDTANKPNADTQKRISQIRARLAQADDLDGPGVSGGEQIALMKELDELTGKTPAQPAPADHRARAATHRQTAAGLESVARDASAEGDREAARLNAVAARASREAANTHDEVATVKRLQDREREALTADQERRRKEAEAKIGDTAGRLDAARAKEEAAKKRVEELRAGRTSPQSPATAVDNPAVAGNTTPVQPQIAGANQGGWTMTASEIPTKTGHRGVTPSGYKVSPFVGSAALVQSYANRLDSAVSDGGVDAYGDHWLPGLAEAGAKAGYTVDQIVAHGRERGLDADEAQIADARERHGMAITANWEKAGTFRAVINNPSSPYHGKQLTGGKRTVDANGRPVIKFDPVNGKSPTVSADKYPEMWAALAEHEKGGAQ